MDTSVFLERFGVRYMRDETASSPVFPEIIHVPSQEHPLKRCFDLLLASLGLVFSLPLWLMIGLAVKMEDGGPLFYSQERVGKGGRKFKIVKFRSMIRNAESLTGPVWASENDGRVTRVGRILRATALDELPQLWNILKGDISFVGPRAERPEFVQKFRKTIRNYDLRLSVRPGLTGLAQVYGRYDSGPRQKLRYDLLYIKKHSVWLDVKLTGLSFWVTFRGKWESRGKKFSFAPGWRLKKPRETRRAR